MACLVVNSHSSPQLSEDYPQLRWQSTEQQTHQFGRRIQEIIKPLIGSLLYRRHKKNGEVDGLVVVRIQTQIRGRQANRGLTNRAQLCPVVKHVDGTVYYDHRSPVCDLSLSNHGTWFRTEARRMYDYSWNHDPWPSVESGLDSSTELEKGLSDLDLDADEIKADIRQEVTRDKQLVTVRGMGFGPPGRTNSLRPQSRSKPQVKSRTRRTARRIGRPLGSELDDIEIDI